MNELLAGVYGTNGFDKTASAGGPSTLAGVASALAAEAVDDHGDMSKVASAQNEIMEHLVSFDQAGRAIAQHEFTQMEKMAFAGDSSAIEAFFGEEMSSEEPSPREIVLDEIQRRLGE
jgi:hypothetical protein